MIHPADPLSDPSSEGEVNLSPLRHAWEAEHVDGATCALLEADAKYFLHQSLSTPCLDSLVARRPRKDKIHEDP